jgi:hypothetical protein
MKSLFKTTLLIVLVVFILSLKVKNDTIFGHLYGIISPATSRIQATSVQLLDQSMDKTQVYTKKLFNNSVPKYKDAVKSKMSSSQKIKNLPAEEITLEEKKQLDSLIKSHH